MYNKTVTAGSARCALASALWEWYNAGIHPPNFINGPAPGKAKTAMTIKSILIIIIMAALFAAAVVFIAQNGGWSSEKGCHGDCAKCHENCDSKEKE